MSRARLAGVALLAASLALLTVGIALLVDGGADGEEPGRLDAALARVEPAHRPFAALTATTVRVGGHRLEVVVADTLAERTQGLRRRHDLGAYDGMLFVFGADSQTTFTMSTVPVPLDIAFYDRHGMPVTRLRMQPCAGTDADCPLYQARRPFRYALETLVDGLPSGRLA